MRAADPCKTYERSGAESGYWCPSFVQKLVKARFIYRHRCPFASPKCSNLDGDSPFPGLALAPDDKQAFVSAVAVAHGRRLRRFLAARLRYAMADVPDLVQEIFVRMLRVEQPESIRSPEAYLFTIAKHVLHQHRTRKSAEPEVADIADVLEELEDFAETRPEARLEAEQRLAHLERTLSQLPRKAYATLILHRVKGLTLEEIGKQLGVSRSMAKKYLTKALTHCRQLDAGE